MLDYAQLRFTQSVRRQGEATIQCNWNNLYWTQLYSARVQRYSTPARDCALYYCHIDFTKRVQAVYHQMFVKLIVKHGYNREFVASTHGDHTVKIFKHCNSECVHVFHGHPRTPWTVKFHPSDSNIVASGCLGCEVQHSRLFANRTHLFAPSSHSNYPFIIIWWAFLLILIHSFI
jgi:WD40 repeat protein